MAGIFPAFQFIEQNPILLPKQRKSRRRHGRTVELISLAELVF
jgi:hypothetical protein